MRAVIIKNTGSLYLAKNEQGEYIECRVKGNFRLKGIRSTNPIAVGDRVEILLNQEDTAYITAIEERRNYIIRRASNLSKESHILAANIDLALLIVTLHYPTTHLAFIDRFLATAEAYQISTCLIFNKIDRYSPEERVELKEVMNLYQCIGYECHTCSAATGEGMEEIRYIVGGKVTLLSGNSGVGKSTLINRLLPSLHIKTGNISASHHKGMHTTTFSEMHELPEGGYIIDTPGIKGFGTIDFSTEEVAHYFRELFDASRRCRFNNCTHRHEPGCAVLAAVEAGDIALSRYHSYLSIIEDSTESRYRQ